MNIENPNRIAVLNAMPCRGSIDYLKRVTPNHYRYTLFERRVRTGKYDPVYNTHEVIVHNKILLRYEDMNIHEFLAGCSFSFAVDRNLPAFQSPVRGLPNWSVASDLSLGITGEDRIHAHYLGVIDGYNCYVTYKESYRRNHQVPYRFSLRSVPKYGKSNVVYQVDTAREAFQRPNITNTHIKTGDGFDELALFDKMDALIAPIMEPMVALLSPVREDK